MSHIDGGEPTELAVLSWNLFHGRDDPPDHRLLTLRSRLLRRSEDDGAYVQVNRSLEREFAQVLAGAHWSLALLQEVPPAWAGTLARATGAQPFRVLTSRNELRPLTTLVGRWNPDLIASWEGGSNVVLVRAPCQIVPGSERSLLLNPLRERVLRQRLLRERRRMAFVRVRNGEGVEVGVANLHASTGPPAQTEREVLRAAAAAVRWSAGTPLVFGGDFNARPERSPKLFEELERRFGLAPPTAPDAIDHLLARGLAVVSPPRRWPPERRELEISTARGPRLLRLSDHAPVAATFSVRPDGLGA